jgi:hypothetical protein
VANRARALLLQLTLATAVSAYGCPQLLSDDFEVADPQQCAPFRLCDNACVDTQSNAKHCGACGAAIADGQICSMGAAVRADVGCGMRTLCNGGCVDTNTHPLFCGGCDVACETSQRCAMGRCECGAPLKNCAGVCRECCTNSDCPGDRTCSEGVCVLHCAAPFSQCKDDCVDLKTDAKNCNTCGNDCGPGGTCANGSCG